MYVYCVYVGMYVCVCNVEQRRFGGGVGTVCVLCVRTCVCMHACMYAYENNVCMHACHMMYAHENIVPRGLQSARNCGENRKDIHTYIHTYTYIHAYRVNKHVCNLQETVEKNRKDFQNLEKELQTAQ